MKDLVHDKYDWITAEVFEEVYEIGRDFKSISRHHLLDVEDALILISKEVLFEPEELIKLLNFLEDLDSYLCSTLPF